MAISLDEFLQLRKTHAVVDVRSEGEFEAGHIPDAFNIPILNNQERVIVGTAYKQQGQRTAIREGFRLVGPRLNDLIDVTDKIADGKELLVHCWRGGMRSVNFCQFVSMAGIRTKALEGGYKIYRTKALDTFKARLSIILLSGLTGSGKSEVLRTLATQGEQIIDLEHLASHKGSVFGGLFMPPQPTTEQFQNNLFETILALDPTRRIWIEDESQAIGRIFLPLDFWNGMKHGQIVRLDVPKSVRIARLVSEYGHADPVAFLEIMSKLTKRLGGQNFNAAKGTLLKGDMAATIDILLTYYDKAYHESTGRRSNNLKGFISWNGEDASDAANAIMDLIKFTEWKR